MSGAPKFHVDRPRDLRAARPWHRLAYLVNTLPRELERLAREIPAPPGSRVLDYGCADAPYRHFFPAADYVGADLPGNPDATMEIAADGTLPAADASVDVVLSTQVLEHVTDPGVHLSECFRVLRPGGRVLLSTHGIMPWHPDPVDLWRWTSEGLQRAVGDAGFEVERFEGIVGMAAAGLQLVLDSIAYRVPRPLIRVVGPPLSLVFQSLIALADRLDRPRERRLNALVFGLVARKPPSA